MIVNFIILTENKFRHNSSFTKLINVSYFPILSAPTSNATVNRLKPICIIESVFCLSNGLHNEIKNRNSSRIQGNPYGRSGDEVAVIKFHFISLI